jgi:hypothetical protein
VSSWTPTYCPDLHVAPDPHAVPHLHIVLGIHGVLGLHVVLDLQVVPGQQVVPDPHVAPSNIVLTLVSKTPSLHNLATCSLEHRTSPVNTLLCIKNWS